MTILGELVVEVAQGLWEYTFEAAYKRWGWMAGVLTFLGPIAFLALLMWAIFA